MIAPSEAMTDARKFKLLIVTAAALTALILSYSMTGEYLLPGLGGYVQRRLYYEKVISKKGLGLHKGLYWKEKQ